MANSKSIHNSFDQKWLMKGFMAIVLLSIFVAVVADFILIAAAVPAFVLIVYIALVDFRQLFYVLLFCIPFSVEVNLPGGFATDLPTEPFMVGLMGVYLLFFIDKARALGGAFFRHPITLLLILHLSWILITCFTSGNVFVSVKYLLAKSWYIITFYFLAALFLKNVQDFKKFFWVIFVALTTTILIVFARHAAIGFSFEDVHKVMGPFYRNHVNYASIVALFTPLIWMSRRWYPKWSYTWMAILGALFFYVIAIQFSYTRAAILSLGIAVGAYFIIHFRLIKPSLVLAVIIAIGGISYLVQKNRYMEYAPNYERTISHKRFDNLVEATYKMEDISTMERLYRWVAGAFMIKDKPVFGFGPGNFHNFYRSYTVTAFTTYVSDNPEKSGVHSYYLMTFIEQGIIGLLIFFILMFTVLIRAEKCYHRLTDPKEKAIVLALCQMIIIILALLLINDLIETDKIGPFFFIAMAGLVNFDLKRGSKTEVSLADNG